MSLAYYLADLEVSMTHAVVSPVADDATRRHFLAALGAAGFEILQALGVAPIAVTGVADLPTYLGGGALDLPDIGTFQEPGLEAIASLRPEVIFGNPERRQPAHSAASPRSSRSTPRSPEPWQRATQRHADALGVPERAAALVADHDVRVAALSVEEYALLDGDLLLVNTFGAAEDVAELRAGFEDSALYPTLAAVRAGKVVQLGPHWFFHGPVAAALMLGDLARMYP